MEIGVINAAVVHEVETSFEPLKLEELPTIEYGNSFDFVHLVLAMWVI